MKAIRKHGRRGKKLRRLPVTAALLCKIVDSLNPDSYEDLLFSAAASLGVRGLLRGGEFLQKDADSRILKRSDLTFTREGFSLFLAYLSICLLTKLMWEFVRCP